MISDSGSELSNLSAPSMASSKLEASNSSSVASMDSKRLARAKMVVLESKVILCGKVFLYMLLLGIAAGSAFFVYRHTRGEQELRLQYRAFDRMSSVLSMSLVQAEHMLQFSQLLAVDVATLATTMIASNTSSAWPFVTVPGFAALAAMARESIDPSTQVFLSPIVPERLRGQWETYAILNGDAWMTDEFLSQLETDYHELKDEDFPTIYPHLHSMAGTNQTFHMPVNETADGFDFYSPLWQLSPLVLGGPSWTNLDLLRSSTWVQAMDFILQGNTAAWVGNSVDLGFLESSTNSTDEVGPSSMIVLPVTDDRETTLLSDGLVATLSVIAPWRNFFVDLLPHDEDPMTLVISSSCSESFSYLLDGPDVVFLGAGDYHDEEYDHLGFSTVFNPMNLTTDCDHTLSIYPTDEFVAPFYTHQPVTYTTVVLCVLLFTIAVFFVYDLSVERRQDKVLTKAKKSNAIVASLFPQAIATILMDDDGSGDETPSESNTVAADLEPRMSRRQSSAGSSLVPAQRMKTIAELFPSATVMFADIVGFTAWSSQREPSQVFELLEQIYSSFDVIAKRKKVFKVETIGDCYMAAAGLPDRRDDHAVAMASFARDCLRKMLHVVRNLESSLGPSTADLSLRVGIHSGPVTAGVLRSEKARFQLFGDTVNTAARMESTGAPNRIQVSAETAALIKASKANDIWVIPREDKVEAKGKGELATYWLAYATWDAKLSRLPLLVDDISDEEGGSDGDVAMEVMPEDSEAEKRERSLDWTTEVLLNLLKRIVAMRGQEEHKPNLDQIRRRPATLPLDEVVEVINLHSQERFFSIDPTKVVLPKVVSTQLRSYLREIASVYNPNYFHNFEHATHVTMSVTKLLSRIAIRSDGDSSKAEDDMHEYTHGITSDPLAQFAVTFAALIHDVDHHGVPNATLVNERTTNACRYRNQSVAEQNSVDLAWELLAFDSYSELRACIYSNEEEFQRFRQLVVNAVMATDIADKRLGAARKARWQKAFEGVETDKVVDANRKATIVIEHLIQASDVAHTMQHWHVYIRWNERFFHECYAAYLAGRVDKDPSLNWFRSELGFFDHYVIPLAKKLKDCQVFGVASDEYLNYAEANRMEWEVKGLDLVRGYLSRHKNPKKSTKKTC